MSLLRNASLIALGLTILSTSMAQAQTRPQAVNAHEAITQDNCVTGTIDIAMGDRNARTNDNYRLALNVADWTMFSGSIMRVWGGRIGQGWRPVQMNYDINGLINAPGRGVLRLGQVKGVMAIDNNGRYSFRASGVEPFALQRFGIDGQPQGTLAPFDGSIQGKAAASYLSGFRNQVTGFTRNVMGRPVPMAGVTATDPLRFNNVQMQPGPWPSLFAASLSGDFTYAYQCPQENLQCRDGLWTTQQGMELRYANSDPQRGPVLDRLSGTIQYKDVSNSTPTEVVEYRDNNNLLSKTTTRINPTGVYEVGMLFNAEGGQDGDDALLESANRQNGDDDLLLSLASSGQKPSLGGKIYFVDQRDGNDKLVTSKAYFQLKCNNISRAQAANFMRVYQLIIASLHDD